MDIILMARGKISLIYRKNSYIFNLSAGALLFVFRFEVLRKNKRFCSITYLGGGTSAHKQISIQLLNLGEGNAFIH